MKVQSRTRNASRNLAMSIIAYVVKIVLSFAVRTLFIRYLGSAYLGVNGLFTNILQILSLAELGIGSALVFSMYKPVADKDEEKVKQLLGLYKKIYFIIACVVLVLGLAILPFLKYFIKDVTEVPLDVNLHVVYLIFLAGSVVSYFSAFEVSLFYVCQRNDITSAIEIIGTILVSTLHIVLLVLTKNFYIYILLNLINTLIQNFLILLFGAKLFPEYWGKPQTKLSKEETRKITSNIGPLMMHKIGAVAAIGIDSIILSKMVGIITVGAYSNYVLIITYVTMIPTFVVTAIKSGIGNSIVKNSVEENKSLFNNLLFMLFWIVGFCSICLFCLFNPFMTIWVKDDSLIFSLAIVAALTIQFFVTNCRILVNSYKECLGYFKQDMFKPLIEAGLNVGLSILLTHFFGVIGVVLGTILSSIFACIWIEPLILYRNYFKQSVWDYWRRFAIYLLGIICAGALTYFVCLPIPVNGILYLVARFAICAIVPNIVFVLLSFKTKEFKYLIGKLKSGFAKLKKKKS